MGGPDVPDGSWVLVVRNSTLQVVTAWWVTVRVNPPDREYKFSAESLHPLPPETLVVLGLAGVRGADAPEFEVSWGHVDSIGNHWRHTGDRLDRDVSGDPV
jgi:hypothetical protein